MGVWPMQNASGKHGREGRATISQAEGMPPAEKR